MIAALLIMKPMMAALGTIWSGALDVLERFRIQINGIALAIAVLTAVVGGWTIARLARDHERLRIEHAARRAADTINADLRAHAALKRGEISAANAHMDQISAEARQLLEQQAGTPVIIPGKVEFVSVLQPIALPAAPAATCAPYPDALRRKLNEINVGVQ